MMETATIFYYNDQWLAKKVRCFDVRYDAQILPAGCVVVGFMKRASPTYVGMILDPPHLTEAQQKWWDFIIEEIKGNLLAGHL